MGNLDDTPTVKITGTIMVIAIISLFLVVVFVLFLHLYAKWFWWRTEQPPAPPPPRRRRRRRFVFTPPPPCGSRGLDPSVLTSLPVVIIQKEDGLECAVCLSEVAEGEKARILPKCSHGFHVDCIDMWFHSHFTCPLCRTSLQPPPPTSTSSTHNHPTTSSSSDDDHLNEQINLPNLASDYYSRNDDQPPNFPADVLYWGDQTQFSSTTGTGGGTDVNVSSQEATSSSTTAEYGSLVVIDVNPDGEAAGVISCDGNYMGEAEEESKEPAVAVGGGMAPTRLRSLKRMLSRERIRVAPTSPPDSPDHIV